MKPSISIVIPALNEEKNIELTVEAVQGTLQNRVSDFEIIIVDDGSKDKTGDIADRLATENPRVRVVHNPINMGLGFNYRRGADLARMDYLMLVPGDNEIPGESMSAIVDHLGVAPIIIPYITNTPVRSISRRIISKTFIVTMNLLFGLRLKWYTGICAIRSDILKTVPVGTNGFAYMPTVLVRLLRQGHTFIQVGIQLQQRPTGSSKIFKLKNVISVIKTVFSLLWEVHFKSRNVYSKGPIEVSPSARATGR